jgi:hypothetical protein
MSDNKDDKQLGSGYITLIVFSVLTIIVATIFYFWRKYGKTVRGGGSNMVKVGSLGNINVDGISRTEYLSDVQEMLRKSFK